MFILKTENVNFSGKETPGIFFKEDNENLSGKEMQPFHLMVNTSVANQVRNITYINLMINYHSWMIFSGTFFRQFQHLFSLGRMGGIFFPGRLF